MESVFEFLFWLGIALVIRAFALMPETKEEDKTND